MKLKSFISNLRITPAAKFIWQMTSQLLWHKFNCFSLKDARKINDFLLWSILPTAMICYAIMYWILPAKATDAQWFTLFITKAVQFLFLSVISYYYFKGSRNAGIATAVMIYAGVNFMAELFGFSSKMFWVHTMALLFFLSVGTFMLLDIRNRCKNGGKLL